MSLTTPKNLRAASDSSVHQVTDADRDRLLAEATALRFDTTRIDLARCRDKTDLLERVARALSFPEWFGRNWDALADLLDDLSWRPAPGYLLVLDGATTYRAAHEGDHAVLRNILDEACARWAGRDIPFWVLLT